MEKRKIQHDDCTHCRSHGEVYTVEVHADEPLMCIRKVNSSNKLSYMILLEHHLGNESILIHPDAVQEIIECLQKVHALEFSPRHTLKSRLE